MIRHRPQRVLQIRLSFRAAEVRQQNHLRSSFAQQLDCWEALSDSGVVRDPNFPVNFFGRNIEIDPHKYTPAFNLKVAN
jgi:hypothetical protein